jgi:signal peptidase
MTALRWTRRTLDAILVAAVVAVALIAGLTILAPVLGGRTMVIGGGSMEPAIGRGTLILALPGPPYAVGDVITVQQGGATPYTHRVTRLAELDGRPFVETKGDANPAPDPAIVPVEAIVGRVVVALPLLGYLSLLLATAAGLVGFLALGTTLLLVARLLEEVEERRCPACAAAPADGALADVAAPGALALPGGPLAALPAFAAPIAPTRVRETGRARDPRTPVVSEADRRDPRRRRLAPASQAEAAVAGPSAGDRAA